jgi:hypothetical protein
MAVDLESVLGRACARWVATVERRPHATLIACAVLMAILGVYAARNLGVNADPRALIARHLPFQERQRDLTRTFHTLADGILIVIDADSAMVAGRAAEALAARLAERTDLFSQVDVPGGGPFFAQNALLYLEPERLSPSSPRWRATRAWSASVPCCGKC